MHLYNSAGSKHPRSTSRDLTRRLALGSLLLGSFATACGQTSPSQTSPPSNGAQPAARTSSKTSGQQTAATTLQRRDQITVTAYGTALPASASASSTRVVTAKQLQESAWPALGDQLRQVPGVELFRRSSTLIANPTAQGISLRGLGSTASSRTLVLSDHVPLNDAFGGWVHWEEFPSLTIQSVEVVRGGASDLYGSSAVGGVVNVIQTNPEQAGRAFHFDASEGSENTRTGALEGSFAHGAAGRQWAGLAAMGIIRTDGYTLIAPNLRGPVDTNSNVHLENAAADLRRDLGPNASLFLRGNAYNDARANGTRLQTNGIRLWRYSTGGDWSPAAAEHLMLRLYGSNAHYRQTFSAIAPNRQTERLTRRLKTPAEELGGKLESSTVVARRLTLLAGVETHDIRGLDDEVPIANSLPNGLSVTTARQRDTGGYGEALLNLQAWTLSAGMRVDHFGNFDARQWKQAASGTPTIASTIPDRVEIVANPRIGVVRRLTPQIALTATAFRAFRSPTIYELYRTGQVGQATTLANPDLLSERATGVEGGTQLTSDRQSGLAGTLRLSYFWTVVNRPVTALTLHATPTTILKQRDNLGQIRSAGVALDYDLRPLPWLSVIGGYQYADATVTRFDQQPSLIGKWIPQVAHQMATMSVRASHSRWGEINLLARTSGRQFDDDVNTYMLHGYFSLDAHAEHSFGQRLVLYASGSNLFDRSIEAGKTPVLTLASPRIVTIGLRIGLPGSASQ